MTREDAKRSLRRGEGNTKAESNEPPDRGNSFTGLKQGHAMGVLTGGIPKKDTLRRVISA